MVSRGTAHRTTNEPDLATVAAALGEPARAAMCLALMDARGRPASELARAARVSAQAASNHLAKLSAAGVVRVERQGGWRYYRLANEHVAHAIEALAVVSPPTVPSSNPTGLHAARTCYRHLAGALGVAVADALVGNGWLAEDGAAYRVTPTGADRLKCVGIDAGKLARGSRPAARRCIDWSERRPHVAGPLGTALADLALARGWVRRQAGTRAVLLTPVGRAEFRRVFNVCL